MLKNKFKLMSAVMLAVPFLASTGFTTTVSACSAPVQPISYNQCYYSFASFQTKLDALVSAGTISSAQESTILNLYYNGQIGSRSNFKAQLDVLVSIGTITQAQEYSILNVFTSWGSSWYIPAPPSGSSHRPMPRPVQPGRHNTPTPKPTPEPIHNNGGGQNRTTPAPNGNHNSGNGGQKSTPQPTQNTPPVPVPNIGGSINKGGQSKPSTGGSGCQQNGSKQNTPASNVGGHSTPSPTNGTGHTCTK